MDVKNTVVHNLFPPTNNLSCHNTGGKGVCTVFKSALKYSTVIEIRSRETHYLKNFTHI